MPQVAAPIIFLRGLDIRCEWSIAVPGIQDEEQRQEQRYDLLFQALSLGWEDYARGREDVPPLFEGEPELVSAWRDGQYLAADAEAMEDCPG